MYQTLNKNDYQRILKLEYGYKVEAVLSFGHYDAEKQLTRLKKSLSNIGTKYTLTRKEDFLRNIFELKIAEKNYWFIVEYGGVILCEYLHFSCLFGSKRNIHIGNCGGLYPKMESVDFLIPTWTFGNESSTRFYDRKNINNIHYPDKKLSGKIKSKLSGEKIWEGPIITCEAMLAETKEDVIQWSKEGYFGVEMETSTVFAVSNYFKVPSCALVYVADNLIKNQTVADESYILQKEARDKKAQKMFDVALSVLLEK